MTIIGTRISTEVMICTSTICAQRFEINKVKGVKHVTTDHPQWSIGCRLTEEQFAALWGFKQRKVATGLSESATNDPSGLAFFMCSGTLDCHLTSLPMEITCHTSINTCYLTPSNLSTMLPFSININTHIPNDCKFNTANMTKKNYKYTTLHETITWWDVKQWYSFHWKPCLLIGNLLQTLFKMNINTKCKFLLGKYQITVLFL